VYRLFFGLFLAQLLIMMGLIEYLKILLWENRENEVGFNTENIFWGRWW